MIIGRGRWTWHWNKLEDSQHCASEIKNNVMNEEDRMKRFHTRMKSFYILSPPHSWTNFAVLQPFSWKEPKVSSEFETAPQCTLYLSVDSTTTKLSLWNNFNLLWISERKLRNECCPTLRFQHSNDFVILMK